MDNNYYYLIGGFTVIAWAAIVLTWIILRHRRGNGVDGDAIAKRLDAIDGRLAAVEKTLNDIP